MRIDEALTWAVALLEGGESPSVDAKVLLANTLNVNQTYLFTWPDKVLDSQSLHRFQKAVERRRLGEPVAYIIGERDFWTLKLATSPHTLIPRPDTEVLVEQVLKRIPSDITRQTQSSFSICDLGSGTGAIALALASELPHVHVTGVDFKAQAVELAKQNAVNNGIKNVTFLHSDWFTELGDKQFNIIVSNPPYIEDTSDYLSQGDVKFEPKSALTSGEDGLRDIRHIISVSQEYLLSDGLLAFEHGFNQGAAVAELLGEAGFIDVETIKDYGGNDRVTLGRCG
ncbi:peptide chain release factor N(5)-glutamine methyltransferase [Alteromonas sp. BMJM2]|uniref:peptide chain release factor N(5)-glutamine methyltransferase n=1 Tax=Alteromonas sp. BMJM2 TaxID=2954241 RepID=UPI0022B4FFD9|nr:peptide chain release factor N(5)-glutamine methyltransferase [Alteromonas sp. BMJM2]